MQKLSHRTQSFAGFTLDLTRGCLLRGSEEIKLRPKPFEALKYLVENPGRLISKAELMQTLWPDTAVTDDSLVQCLMEIRRALSDDAQQIIKTVPRRGYIFEPEVREKVGPSSLTTYTEETGVQLIIEEEETDGTLTRQAPASERVRMLAPRATMLERVTSSIHEHKLATVLGVLTLAVVVAGITYFSRPGDAIDSVAVMPFVNVSGDPNVEYLADGISDGIINDLSQLPSLKKVIAFNSVLRYKGKPTDPQTAARELNVRAVLMGRIMRRGDELSISVELVDARDNRRLWGEQFERKMSEFSTLTSELARRVTDHLRLKLSNADQGRLVRPHTENAEAYQFYLQGRYFWNKGTREGEEKAVGYFQQAIYKDPNYAPAYAGLADCYIVMASAFRIPAKEGFENARSAATKALELDTSLSEAHTSLAAVMSIYDWNWRGAEQEHQRAIELNPNDAMAHESYSDNLCVLGQHALAIAEVKRAQQLDPLSLRINSDVGLTLLYAHHFDEALAELQKGLELDPNYLWTHRALGMVYEQKKMYPEAIAEFQKVQELTHSEAGALALAHAYAIVGRKDEATQILERFKSRGNAMAAATIYAGLGQKDETFEWLEKAYQNHAPTLVELKVDPRWDDLRDDPRFISLLHRMKLDS